MGLEKYRTKAAIKLAKENREKRLKEIDGAFENGDTSVRDYHKQLKEHEQSHWKLK